MRKIIILLLWLAAWQVLLPAILCAGMGIDTTVTTGPDKYLANYTSLRFSLMNKLDLEWSYSYTDSDLSTEPTQAYSGGISVNLADDFSLRGNYSITPKVAGYEADGYSLGTTVTFYGWPSEETSRDTDFQTAIDLDYSLVNNTYDVHTDSFTVYYRTQWGRYRQAAIPAKDTSETIKQTSWTLGVTETFYTNTSLYLGYCKYVYDPDIEEDIVLYNASARKSNARIFSMSPGLGGFPKYSYEVRISRNFLSLWTMSADYLHADVLQFTFNENGSPFNGTVGSLLDDFYEVAGVNADSYTLGIDYYLNAWITLNANYNLYREVYKDNGHYYSLGITLIF